MDRGSERSNTGVQGHTYTQIAVCSLGDKLVAVDLVSYWYLGAQLPEHQDRILQARQPPNFKVPRRGDRTRPCHGVCPPVVSSGDNEPWALLLDSCRAQADIVCVDTVGLVGFGCLMPVIHGFTAEIEVNFHLILVSSPRLKRWDGKVLFPLQVGYLGGIFQCLLGDGLFLGHQVFLHRLEVGSKLHFFLLSRAHICHSPNLETPRATWMGIWVEMSTRKIDRNMTAGDAPRGGDTFVLALAMHLGDR